MRKNRKYILKLTGIALLAALMLGVGTTAAVIRHTMSLNNEIETPTVSVAIEETVGEAADGVKPKEVDFVNTGSADVFLRIAYAPLWTYTEEDGDEIILSNTDSDGAEIADIVWPEWSDNNWYDGKDGWYYYKKVLKSGERIEDVVTEVQFPASYEDSRYAEADYQLHFQVEVVQASDTWTVSADAVSEVFEKTITADADDWKADKYNAVINWQ